MSGDKDKSGGQPPAKPTDKNDRSSDEFSEKPPRKTPDGVIEFLKPPPPPGTKK